ncbi:3-hydroxyisobutyryl-CoA hydrolase-like protein 5 [Capsicum annuum]|uniref:3-hydroxyisobutyryl-CoA hydrolase-like protein 5 n=1 Tax=Capsicum annuum TaxID=4072 RepID=UPI001FB13425|nr:3-hydroxyisobutyryl-CoA hydrolase-like protein 5 [Capsicum annuum]
MGIASFPSSILMFSTPPKRLIHDREVDIAEEIGCARVLTLNRPNQINFISNKMALMLGQKLEKYEKDDNVELVIIKGAGRTFSADGNVKAAVEQKFSLRGDSWFELAYRIYRLCYHIHTYKKPHIALVHGMSVDGGASLMVPMKYSIVTEKAWYSTPEASLGFHPYCAFSYMLSRLSGRLGEYLGLTGERLRGKDVVAAGLATRFVPSQKLFQLEKCLLSISNGEEDVIRSVIDEFSTNVQIDERSILNKLAINNECFSRKSVEEIVDSFEVEAGKKGNDWIVPVLKRKKKASPTGLKITLKSIREGRKQTLSECLRREFRITINTLQTIISDDFSEGIRAIIIDKDKSPKWNPSTLDEVHDEQLDLIFKPFEEHDLELQIPVKKDECRCQKSKEGIVKSNTPNYDLLTG